MIRILNTIFLSISILAAFSLSPTLCAQSKRSKTAKTPSKTVAKTPKQDPYELAEQAGKAFDEYQFEKAKSLQEEYIKLSHIEEPAAFWFLDQCELGQNMLQRVENIAIIDSFTVDKDKFFEAYRLSPSSGRLESPSSLPEELKAVAPAHETPLFVSESGDMIIWPTTDADGFSKMVVSNRLADGSWETPASLSEAIDGVVDAVWDTLGYPFLMSDGATLYFAATTGSLGGYDIFVTRDNGNGFLEPQNIGMPYNSPYDDYMLAIDDVTGAGWWATDRNQIPDKVTIYVFVPQELRINYPADDTDLIDRAKITTIVGTGASQENNERVLAAIRNLDNTPAETTEDFRFALPGGRILHRLSDFTSPEAVEAMKLYLDARFNLLLAEDRLAELRQSPEANTSHRAESLQLENSITARRSHLKSMANDVVRLETGR